MKIKVYLSIRIFLLECVNYKKVKFIKVKEKEDVILLGFGLLSRKLMVKKEDGKV